MGTWLPETCWATIRREIKNTKVTSSWFFLSTLNYDARSTTHQVSNQSTVEMRKKYKIQPCGGNLIYVQLFVVVVIATFYFTARCIGRKLSRSIGRCCILYYHCVCTVNTVRTPLGNKTISSPFQRVQCYRFYGILCYTTHYKYIHLPFPPQKKNSIQQLICVPPPAL